MLNINELKLAKDLIRYPSITPKDAGVINFLSKQLRLLGFHCKILEFKDKKSKPIKNLYARIGKQSPNICYAGHTDVVPPGNIKDWTTNPFKPSIKKNHLITFLKGFVMGVAEIIPGISGGTVALILGIYKRLIDSISQFNLIFLKRIGEYLFKEAFKQVDIYFLFFLFLGMLVAIFSLSSLLSFLLFSYAVFFKFPISSLLASSLFLKEIRPLTIDKSLFLGILFSAIIGLSLFASPVIETESPSSIYIFFAGFLAICALVLPGISGSFILLLIGVYPVIIVSISTLDIVTLSIFSLGCIVGLLSAVRIIKTIYERNRSLMRAFFFGLILFSIPLLWKEDQFLIIVPNVSEFLLDAVIGILLGIGLIFLLEKART